MSVELVQGDVGIALTGLLTDEDDAALPLTNVDSVFFQMRRKNDNRYTVNAEADIIDANAGKVRYVTATNDLNNSGDFLGQFEIHYLDGTIQTSDPMVAITIRRQ